MKGCGCDGEPTALLALLALPVLLSKRQYVFVFCMGFYGTFGKMSVVHKSLKEFQGMFYDTEHVSKYSTCEF